MSTGTQKARADILNAKQKGNRGERELLAILQEHGFPATRNDQTFVGGLHNPDISCTVDGVPLHIECKRVEKLSLAAAVKQARRDADGLALPVIAHRRNREEWLLTIPLKDILAISDNSNG